MIYIKKLSNIYWMIIKIIKIKAKLISILQLYFSDFHNNLEYTSNKYKPNFLRNVNVEKKY